MSIFLIIVLIVAVLVLVLMGLDIYSRKVNNKYIEKRNQLREQENARIAAIPNIRKLIYFSDELPFNPVAEQIIYIETAYQPHINEFITTRYDDICQLFANSGYKFFYFPRFAKKIQAPAFNAYNFPDQQIDSSQFADVSTNCNTLLTYLSPDSNVTTGFIRFRKNSTPKNTFSYYEFDDTELWLQITNYISMVAENPIMFSLGKPDMEIDRADFDFWQQSQQLVDEIKERIDKLRIMGVEEMLLKSLIAVKPTLSRLQITSDYKILLPDYNKEIALHPLPKAIFLLFLKHPEGILFKNMPDYKAELKQIYKKICNTDDLNRIAASIADVTDPTKNAINEKCSRIREAFLSQITDELAQNYYITGMRSEPKSITLDRTLVRIEINF